MGDVIVPLKRLGNDTILCSVSLELDNPTNMVMRAESANLCHQPLTAVAWTCLGRSKTTKTTTPEIWKHRLTRHREKLTTSSSEEGDVRRYKAVSTGFHRPDGPISPPVLGGFQYFSKVVGQKTKTKWKEVFSIKAKRDAIKTLQLFNQSLVVPSGFGLEHLRGDKVTEYTCRELRKCCLQIGVKLDFASTSTLEQIGVKESTGRTLAAMVRCPLTDSGLSTFLWGELMQTAAYLSNRVPHAGLGNITLYNALYGKDANLGHLRAIWCRAFVHVESHTRMLDPKAWEGRLHGYSIDTANRSASTMQRKET